jgi:aryl-alcohol dehydrogenase-like predicted oxidoreductase
MRYRPLGRTGTLVSELCLGTMTFGGEGIWEHIGTQQQAEATELVRRALEGGVNFLDTANVYSHGTSERMLGSALLDLGVDRGQVVLATKVRGRMAPGANGSGLSRGHIIDQVHRSLERLQTDHIDLYQIHGFDPLTPLETTLRALTDLVREGTVRAVGASNLAAWQLAKALWVSDREGLERFESLQAYYTVAGRDLEREVVPLLRDQELGLMVWSPLAGGLLSGKFDRSTDKAGGARRDSFDFPPVNRERAWDVVDVLREIAAERGVSVAQLALAWLLHQDAVTSVIIGARKMSQLEDNLASVEVRFTDEELARIDEVSALPPEYPGWMVARQGGDRDPAHVSENTPPVLGGEQAKTSS